MTPFRVVICGAGIAGLEALLRLRRLVGDSAEITVIAPNEQFGHRPLAVREPFHFPPAQRYPVRKIVADAGAVWIRDEALAIDASDRLIDTKGALSVPYDAVLIAIGARLSGSLTEGLEFSDVGAAAAYEGLVADIEDGYTKRVAFITPKSPAWLLPLYELALLTARQAKAMGIGDCRLFVISAEPGPLAAFGTRVGDAVHTLLYEAGIDFFPNTIARVSDGVVFLEPGNRKLDADRIVSLPHLAGPSIHGIPLPYGFIPIDSCCSVRDAGGRVFAAGDATDFPIKHGGLAAQQARIAAAGIARLAGAEVEPSPSTPMLRATFLTGNGPLYISAQIVDGKALDCNVSEEAPRSASEKVDTAELGPYLAGLDAKS